MSSGAIRIVVTSRRRLLRDALCAYLAGRPDFTVVGHTGGVDELAALCQLRRPDAVLVEAVQVTAKLVNELRWVRTAVPTAELVVTYDEISPPARKTAVEAGIAALVPRSHGLDTVLRAVHERAHASTRVRQPDGAALTDYDLWIVALLSRGHSVPEMAELLQISRRTVENHKRRLYAKLGASTASEAVSRATSLGLVDPPRPQSQPRPEEPGRSPLAVVHGSDGPDRRAVQQALLAAGTPFVTTLGPAVPDRDHWARWHRGPLMVVLVDPAHQDWLVPAALGAHTVVVLTNDPDLATLVDLLLRGVAAMVHSDRVAADLAVVLSVVAHGYLAMCRARMVDLAERLSVRLADGAAHRPALTSRDADILSALAAGRTIRQTGQLLGITAKSVENAQARLYRKLGARNRAEALTIAHRSGLLDLSSPGDTASF